MEEYQDFGIGDAVYHRTSPNELLYVKHVSIGDKYVICTWITKSGVYQKAEFGFNEVVLSRTQF